MNLVEKLVAQPPEQTAIIDSRRSVSFSELTKRVQGGAAFLKKENFESGDHILVLHPITIELYEILLSCFYAGIVVILVDPAKGPDFMKQCLKWLPPKAYIGSPKAQLLRFRYPQLRQAISTGPKLPFTTKWNSRIPPCDITNVKPDHPALITFTSGSTGMPKAIVRSHSFLISQDTTLARNINLQAKDIDLVTLPVFLLSNLSHGVTSVIADTDLTKPGFPEVPKILEQVRNHGINRCTASPAFFEKMPDEFFAPLSKIYTGGAPVFPELLKRFPPKFHSVYGSSEAEPIAHFAGTDLTPAIEKRIASGEGLPAGKPVDEIALRIVEDEIWVSGDHVLKGYYQGRGDEETKVNVDGIMWHRTGDAGRLDLDDNLWLLGRHSKKWQDFFPLQIEAAIHTLHPGARCAFLDGILYLERDLKISLPWISFDGIKVVGKIPMDSRHNAKVDYAALTKIR